MRAPRRVRGTTTTKLFGPRLPLRAYFLALVSLLVLGAVATSTFVSVQSDRDARARAVEDAGFAATASARQLGTFLGSLKRSTAGLAASPGIEQILITSKGCSLTFAGIGGPDSSRIDIVRADGTVLCSSRVPPAGTAAYHYVDKAWLRRATVRPIFVPLTTDELTGAHMAVSAVPIAGGKGVIAALGDLDSVGPTLAAAYGGGRSSEFLVTSFDRTTVLSRSIAPKRWVGKSLARTAFAQTGETVERRDLDGVGRFYMSAPVPGAGWRFYVGEDKQQALAAQDRLKHRQLVVLLLGLLASLLVAWLIYRSIVAPIGRLSGALRATRGEARALHLETSGPTEVRALGEDINSLIASVNRELAERLESEGRYRDLFENATDLIAVLDLTGRVVNLNAAFSHALGRDREDLIGRSMPELLPPGPDAEPEPARSRQATTVYERELEASDGRVLQVEIGSRLIEEEGRPTGWETICRDITERKQLEEQLRQAQRLESGWVARRRRRT